MGIQVELAERRVCGTAVNDDARTDVLLRRTVPRVQLLLRLVEAHVVLLADDDHGDLQVGHSHSRKGDTKTRHFMLDHHREEALADTGAIDDQLLRLASSWTQLCDEAFGQAIGHVEGLQGSDDRTEKTSSRRHSW